MDVKEEEMFFPIWLEHEWEAEAAALGTTIDGLLEGMVYPPEEALALALLEAEWLENSGI